MSLAVTIYLCGMLPALWTVGAFGNDWSVPEHLATVVLWPLVFVGVVLTGIHRLILRGIGG